MNILWLTWKDIQNPLAGGAESLSHGIAKRLVKEGHRVKMLTSKYKGAKKQEKIDGISVIRLGNRFTVYFKSYKYFKHNLKLWPDLIIEEINTIPFFSQLYSDKKRILLIYQLCREIWFHQMIFPLNLIGFLVEPIYLRMLKKNKVLTISNSTKKDLLRYGFKKNNISIFPIAISKEKISHEFKNQKKESVLLSLGYIRSMKQTHHQIIAFEKAKKSIPNLKLIIVGDMDKRYGNYVLKLIEKSSNKNDIKYLGIISEEEKIEILKKSKIILSTSIKEGWGLTITEAARQGTPAIVYNVDGLRDSVIDHKTGIICKNNTSESLSKSIVNLIRNKKLYNLLQKNAEKEAKKYTYKNSYKKFKYYAGIS